MVLELVDCLVALREQSHLTFCDASTDGITGFVSGCRNWKERPIPSIEPKRIFAKSLNPGMAELGGTPNLERTTGAKMELGCLNHRSRINSVNDVSTPFCYLTIAFHLSDTKTTNNCSFSVFSFFRKIAFSKDATIRRRKDCWVAPRWPQFSYEKGRVHRGVRTAVSSKLKVPLSMGNSVPRSSSVAGFICKNVVVSLICDFGQSLASTSPSSAGLYAGTN